LRCPVDLIAAGQLLFLLTTAWGFVDHSCTAQKGMVCDLVESDWVLIGSSLILPVRSVL
jgi:hypothetical protein